MSWHPGARGGLIFLATFIANLFLCRDLAFTYLTTKTRTESCFILLSDSRILAEFKIRDSNILDNEKQTFVVCNLNLLRMVSNAIDWMALI